MTTGDAVRVHYAEGQAKVSIGDRALYVERRDNEARTYTCPVELITAALGS